MPSQEKQTEGGDLRLPEVWIPRCMSGLQEGHVERTTAIPVGPHRPGDGSGSKVTKDRRAARQKSPSGAVLVNLAEAGWPLIHFEGQESGCQRGLHNPRFSFKSSRNP